MAFAETLTAPPSADPVLAGPSVPAKPLGFLKMLQVAKENPFAAFSQGAYEQPIFEISMFGQKSWLINDPAAVKQVLLDNVENYPKARQEVEALGSLFGDGILTSDGEKWRAHRKIMSPAFDVRSLAAYAPSMARTTEAFLPRWAALDDGAVIDVGDEMTKLTLQIISETMFSSDMDSMTDLVGSTFAAATDRMDFSLLDVLPVIGRVRMRQMVKEIHGIFHELDAAVAKLITDRAERREAGHQDLLARLVAAQDDESGVGMSPREVRDQVVTIFVAGHETTAVAMTWTWYLLSQHPAEEAKLHAELVRVLGGRTPTRENLPNLPYTRMILEEAMRLYPPAPGISMRTAIGPDTLCGQAIPKGAAIAIMPWILHRHRALWERPERFEPERFLPARSVGRSRYAYIPFGGGPRVCIGMAMAMQEATIILATLAQRYRLELAPGCEVELAPRITLRPRNPMKMILHRR
ncbi:MAG TPA: cytochrome P450 [Caulobacteraceae bacterium]|jgi:cytochrome P450|nr:cytochrome P450 [Caulobacteraceae bacterium]